MLKKIFKVVKKIIMAAVLIFAYNKISLSLNATIPLNVLTILLVSFFGIPSIFFLVVFYLVVL